MTERQRAKGDSPGVGFDESAERFAVQSCNRGLSDGEAANEIRRGMLEAMRGLLEVSIARLRIEEQNSATLKDILDELSGGFDRQA